MEHGPEELFTLEQLLERFITEVTRIQTSTQSSSRRLENNIRSQVGQLRRDLSRQITREVDALRSELAVASLPPRFPQFNRLPLEIRTRIWEFALPSRILELRTAFLPRVGPPLNYHGAHPPPVYPHQNNAVWPPHTNMGMPGPRLVSNRLPPPALASVCHESRMVTCRRGAGLVPTKAIEEQPPLHAPSSVPTASYGQAPSAYINAWTWFDPKNDWLKMPGHGPASGTISRFEQHLPSLQGIAEQVLIRKPNDRNEMQHQLEKFALTTDQGSAFPSIKRIGVVVSHDMVRPRGGWDWMIPSQGVKGEMRLFRGGDPIRFVDLKDERDVAYIATLLTEGSPSLISPVATTGDKTTTGSSAADITTSSSTPLTTALTPISPTPSTASVPNGNNSAASFSNNITSATVTTTTTTTTDAAATANANNHLPRPSTTTTTTTTVLAPSLVGPAPTTHPTSMNFHQTTQYYSNVFNNVRNGPNPHLHIHPHLALPPSLNPNPGLITIPPPPPIIHHHPHILHSAPAPDRHAFVPSSPLSQAAELWLNHLSHIRANNPWTSRFCASFKFRSTAPEEFEACWVTIKYRHFPLTISLASLVNTDDMAFVSPVARSHPWVQKELKKMPEIQFFHVFILDDDGRDFRRLYGSAFHWRLNSVVQM